MAEKRVVVTGLGVVTKHGDLARTWSAAESKSTNPAPASSCVGRGLDDYRVLEIGPTPGGQEADARGLGTDPSVSHALLAGEDAAADAGLGAHRFDPYRAGIFVGSSRSTEWARTQCQKALSDGRGLRSDDCLRTMFSAAGVELGRALGFRGPNITHSSTCASSAVAILTASQYVRAGLVDIAIAGGTESCLTEGYIRQTAELGILSKSLCRPFDVSRDGAWLGEGAAFLVLELQEHAERRGAGAKAILAGSATAFDGFAKGNSRTGEALEWAIHTALAQAGLSASSVSSISAHAPGTRIGDALEARVFRRVFGERLRSIQINSLKPITGHCIGASAALETALTVHSLSRGVFLPTSITTNPDPALGLRVPLNTEPFPLGAVLKTSSGLGGIHAALVLTR